jgi:apolipoprotein N-acyltransferase
VRLKVLLTVAALYMGLVGLGLIFIPQTFGRGAVPANASPELIAFLRLWGCPLLGIAALDWLTRDAEPSSTRDAVVIGNTIGFGTIAAVDFWGLASGARELTWLFAVVHLLFALAFLWVGRRERSANTSWRQSR